MKPKKLNPDYISNFSGITSGENYLQSSQAFVCGAQIALHGLYQIISYEEVSVVNEIATKITNGNNEVAKELFQDLKLFLFMLQITGLDTKDPEITQVFVPTEIIRKSMLIFYLQPVRYAKFIKTFFPDLEYQLPSDTEYTEKDVEYTTYFMLKIFPTNLLSANWVITGNESIEQSFGVYKPSYGAGDNGGGRH